MKEDFTKYDIKPTDFINYLRYYGEHFNRKLYEFACKQFDKEYYSKETLENILKVHNIETQNIPIWDILYIANWYNNLLYKAEILSEAHLAVFIKSIFEKEADLIFNRWYADMAKQGISIEWSDMI